MSAPHELPRAVLRQVAHHERLQTRPVAERRSRGRRRARRDRCRRRSRCGCSRGSRRSSHSPLPPCSSSLWVVGGSPRRVNRPRSRRHRFLRRSMSLPSPAKQLVVDAFHPPHRPAFVIGVPLVVADRRPAGMLASPPAGTASRSPAQASSDATGDSREICRMSKRRYHRHSPYRSDLLGHESALPPVSPARIRTPAWRHDRTMSSACPSTHSRLRTAGTTSRLAPQRRPLPTRNRRRALHSSNAGS